MKVLESRSIIVSILVAFSVVGSIKIYTALAILIPIHLDQHDFATKLQSCSNLANVNEISRCTDNVMKPATEKARYQEQLIRDIVIPMID